uniref:FLYWCH-type domain-containing protein n=1 Tax=Globodera rostochiensis TaxID=31243 RepID=A0A914HQY9_GLORO
MVKQQKNFAGAKQTYRCTKYKDGCPRKIYYHELADGFHVFESEKHNHDVLGRGADPFSTYTGVKQEKVDWEPDFNDIPWLDFSEAREAPSTPAAGAAPAAVVVPVPPAVEAPGPAVRPVEAPPTGDAITDVKGDEAAVEDFSPPAAGAAPAAVVVPVPPAVEAPGPAVRPVEAPPTGDAITDVKGDERLLMMISE